jgi:NAD(P)-dependent dehydrogenase (short-subunit alcohol dehydrogenase family)
MADNRVALVTGASSGIGEATALRLTHLGFTVYAAARRVDRMAALAGAGVRVEPVDVTDDASMVALVKRIVDENGRIDVLVNNAGYGSYGAVEDVPISEARRQFEVNVFGLARMTQLVLPHMRARRGWDHATKFAVEGLSDALRAEVAPFGIKVVVIEPGAIATEWSGISADGLEATSTGTAYADQARVVSRVLRSTDSSRMASPPQVVANAIGRVVERRRPPTRVAVGGGARGALALRRLLPDRAFDAVLRRGFRAMS